MKPTEYHPAIHDHRTTVSECAALLDLASRVACTLMAALDTRGHILDGGAAADKWLLDRLVRDPDVIALRRRMR